jgi:DNA-binding NarL/FixJ family response regulator
LFVASADCAVDIVAVEEAFDAAHETVHITRTSSFTQRDETLDALSDAQVEIMRLIAAGYGNAEIARRMQMTEDGVNKAVTRLIRQLDLHVGAGRNARVLITQAYAEFTGRAIPRHD